VKKGKKGGHKGGRLAQVTVISEKGRGKHCWLLAKEGYMGKGGGWIGLLREKGGGEKLSLVVLGGKKGSHEKRGNGAL